MSLADGAVPPLVRLACATAVAVLVGAIAPSHAIAQEQRERAPTAEHLWQSYPLRERAEAARRTPVAAPSPSPPAATTPSGAGDAEQDGGGGRRAVALAVVQLLAPLALLALAGGGTLLLRRRRPPVGAPSAPPRALAVTRPPRDASLQFAEPTPPMRNGKRFSRRGTVPRPPDVDAPWTADLRWVEEEGTAWFQAVASLERGGAEVELARSPSIPWPLDGEAAKDLSAAVARLEDSLLAVGWRPLPKGDAWYARRFAWAPAERRPETARATEGERSA